MICTFLFRLIFFCKAAASTAFPLTISPTAGCGDVGRETLPATESNFLGVVTPVLAPVCVPSRLGNCTFRVSRSSSVTHSSRRLLTVPDFNYGFGS